MPFGRVSIGCSTISPLDATIEGKMTGLLAAFNCCLHYKNPTKQYRRLTYTMPTYNDKVLYDFEIQVNDSVIKMDIQDEKSVAFMRHEAIQQGKEVTTSRSDSRSMSIEVNNIHPEADIFLRFKLIQLSNLNEPNKIGFVLPLEIDDTKFKFALEFEEPSGILFLSSNTAHTFADNKFETTEQPDALSFELTLAAPFPPTIYKSDHYAGVSICPTKDHQVVTDVAEYSFIMDCSGSMSGNEIVLARESLQILLHSLPIGAFVNVIRYGSNYEVLSDEPIQLTEDSFSGLLEYAASMEADLGYTYLLGPVTHVYSQPLSIPGSKRRVFILTDGQAFDKDIVMESILSTEDNTIFSVGIGHYSDEPFVEQIAEMTSGDFEFVRNGDDMRFKVVRLLKASQQENPASMQINIEGVTNVKTTNTRPPRWGSSKTFFLKTPQQMGSAMVTVDGIDYPLTEMRMEERALQVFWASKLMGELRTRDNAEQLITQLSIQNKVVSEYTELIGIGQIVRDPSLIQTTGSSMIYIKNLTGKLITLYVDLNSNVEDLKEIVDHEEGIPVDQQQLIFAGEPLEDGNTLQSYSIEEDSTLHLVLKLRGGGCSPPDGRSLPVFDLKFLHNLLELHTAKGTWTNLAKVEAMGRRAKLDLPAPVATASDEIKATILAVALMRRRLLDQKEAWTLIESRAIKWLMAQLPGVDIEQLLMDIINTF